MVEPLGRRTEAESGSRRLKAESRDPPDSTPTELEFGRPAASTTFTVSRMFKVDYRNKVLPYYCIF